MTGRWRFVDAGAMDAPVSFGRMPSLAAGVANGGPEVLQVGLFGRSHFQIGWFEDVDAVLDLDAARALGVDVFRRPVWGGGTAFYDSNASAIVSFFARSDRFASTDEALEALRPAIRRALDAVGLAEARFEGSSDIRWKGRKLGTLIAQSVLGTTVVGGFLNLRKPDLVVYEKIARVPPEKFADKQIDDPVAYICTPAEVRGTDLAYEELRDAVAAAARDVAGLDLEPSTFTPEEEQGTAGFAATVGADDWIRRVSSTRFREAAPPGSRVGFANRKARKLVRAGVALDQGNTIVAAMMAGDMHVSPPDAMDRVAAAIVGANAADTAELHARVDAVFAAPDIDQPDAAAGITAGDCVATVLTAAEKAL